METGALAYGEAFGAAPHMDAAIGKTPIAAEIAAQVVALTCTEPRHQATHWTGRAMAKAIGISLGSVQRIWRAHKLQPHRLRTLPSREDPRGPGMPQITSLGRSSRLYRLRPYIRKRRGSCDHTNDHP